MEAKGRTDIQHGKEGAEGGQAQKRWSSAYWPMWTRARPPLAKPCSTGREPAEIGPGGSPGCLFGHRRLERARGITIFSKQAVLKLPGAQLTLLDTPGHVDFSAEAERPCR